MEEEIWNLSFHGTMSMSTLIVPWKERGCPVGLLYRNRRRKDLFAEEIPGGRIADGIKATISPDGMDHSAESNNALVIPILVASVSIRIS